MSISMTANIMLRTRMQPKFCLWRAVHTSALVSPQRFYVSKTLPALLRRRTFAGHSHDHTHEHTQTDNHRKKIGSHIEHSHSHRSHTDHSHLVESLSMSSSRGTRITLIGLAANVGLTVSKGGAGIIMNSASLVADAAHSLSDLVSDFVTLYTYQMSRRPPDISHPYGYGKYETAGSLAVSSLLIAGAIGIGWHSYEMLINVLANAGESSAVLVDAQRTVNSGLTVATSVFEHNHHGDGVLNPNAAWFALASVGIKEWLYRATIKVGKLEKSDVLIANAWHHRTDSFSSMVALVAIGGSYLGLPILDPIGGILVAGMILKSGMEILVSSSKELLDTGEISEDVANDVRKAIADIKSVDANIIDYHSIRGRKTGPFYLIDLILHVNPEMTVAKAHVLEDSVRKSILVHVPEVKEVLIHLDSETMDAKHLRVGRQDTI